MKFAINYKCTAFLHNSVFYLFFHSDDFNEHECWRRQHVLFSEQIIDRIWSILPEQQHKRSESNDLRPSINTQSDEQTLQLLWESERIQNTQHSRDQEDIIRAEEAREKRQRGTILHWSWIKPHSQRSIAVLCILLASERRFLRGSGKIRNALKPFLTQHEYHTLHSYLHSGKHTAGDLDTAEEKANLISFCILSLEESCALEIRMFSICINTDTHWCSVLSRLVCMYEEKRHYQHNITETPTPATWTRTHQLLRKTTINACKKHVCLF